VASIIPVAMPIIGLIFTIAKTELPTALAIFPGVGVWYASYIAVPALTKPPIAPILFVTLSSLLAEFPKSSAFCASP
jgi:hypothetical protein